jgi:RNA polymerase primary sigma factor
VDIPDHRNFTRRRATIASRRLLTPAEELRLARLVERGDLQAKAELIERNRGPVHSLARKHSDAGCISTTSCKRGGLGLIQAVEKFDHRRRFRFSTYATWWIRRSIIDALGDRTIIHIPRHARDKLSALNRAEAELTTLTPGAVTPAAIAERAQRRVVAVNRRGHGHRDRSVAVA